MQSVLFLLKAAIKLWRIDNMYKQTKNVVKTVGIGLAVGAVAASIGSQVMKSKKPGRHVRKTATKAIHTVGNVVDGLEKMIR